MKCGKNLDAVLNECKSDNEFIQESDTNNIKLDKQSNDSIFKDKEKDNDNGMFGITSYSESGEKHESYKAGISGKLSISDDCLYWSCDYDVPDYPSISDVKFIRSNM